MKKKGHKAIPDFSSKRPQKNNPGELPRVRETGQQPPRVQVIKPQSTSAKGNRRGG